MTTRRDNRLKYFVLGFATFWLATTLEFTFTATPTRYDGKGKEDGWNPKGDHPCTIERISIEDFLKEYGEKGGLPALFDRPIVITKFAVGREGKGSQKSRNSNFQNLTRVDSILNSFPANFTVTLSSSNSFSEHRRTIPFAQYLNEVTTGPALDADMKANETWYFFGETYSSEWKKLLNAYELPPCQTCSEFDLVALSFGIGNSGSGVAWHIHGPGFSEAIHGRKHWILYPFDNEPDFHPDQTSLNWMHYNYAASMNSENVPFECTLL